VNEKSITIGVSNSNYHRTSKKTVRFDENQDSEAEDEDIPDIDVQLSEPLSGRLSETNMTSMGVGMRVHLLKTVLGTKPEDTFQSIQINLSELPYAPSRQPDKQDKAKADRLLGDTARLVLDLRELEVDLTVRPASFPSDDCGNKTTVKEWVQASGTFSTSDKVAMDVPESMLPMIGLVDSIPNAEKQNEAHLARMLAVLKPSRLKLTDTCLADDANVQTLSDPTGPAFIDPSKPLVYAGRMPMAIAGNDYFTKPNQVLNYLEIGPWIPVSDRCETEYSFVCSRWQIRVLAIRVAWPDKKRLVKRSSSTPLPGILWDRTMGFSAMITGQNGAAVSSSKESVKTRIVLILDRAKHAAKIADELDRLAQEEGKADIHRGSSDAKSHLEAFKEMVYFVCPQTSQEVKRIFYVHSKKKKRDQADIAPKKERAGRGKVVDLPPLEPSPNGTAR
jgi:hypothetical protein